MDRGLQPEIQTMIKDSIRYPMDEIDEKPCDKCGSVWWTPVKAVQLDRMDQFSAPVAHDTPGSSFVYYVCVNPKCSNVFVPNITGSRQTMSKLESLVTSMNPKQVEKKATGRPATSKTSKK